MAKTKATAERIAFGRMLKSWRIQMGWTQYTAWNWSLAADFEVISYGNLSILEQGTAGELRHKAFLQLEELNRRISRRDFSGVTERRLRDRLEASFPLGDDDAPTWSAVEFWACYVGRRPIPQRFLQIPEQPKPETLPEALVRQGFATDAEHAEELLKAIEAFKAANTKRRQRPTSNLTKPRSSTETASTKHQPESSR